MIRWKFIHYNCRTNGAEILFFENICLQFFIKSTIEARKFLSTFLCLGSWHSLERTSTISGRPSHQSCRVGHLSSSPVTEGMQFVPSSLPDFHQWIVSCYFVYLKAEITARKTSFQRNNSNGKWLVSREAHQWWKKYSFQRLHKMTIYWNSQL